MSLLFMDSFGGYTTADLPTRWAGGSQFALIDSTVLPPNSQAGAKVLDCTPNDSAYVLSQNYGALSRYILSARIYRAASGFNSGAVFSLLHNISISSTGAAVVLQVTPTGTFITKGDGTILGSGPIIKYQEWHHIECDFTLSTTGAAVLIVYLDGNPTPFINITGVSTQYAVAEQYSLGRAQQNLNANIGGDKDYFADHYVFSGGIGPAPFNAPLAPIGLGAAKMAFAVPTGPGIISDWAANGAATIWECIDQIPQDGDTTYVSDATPGDQYQCVFGALPAMQSLIAVQLSNYARTDDAGPRAYQSGFWKGGVFGYSGVDQFLSGSYNYIQDEFPVNPVTGLAWVPADLTALQFGCKLTV